MTVSTTESQIDYTGNGATTFAIPFLFLANGDLVLTKMDANDVVTTLVLGSDYTLSGAKNPSGGTATLTTPLTTGNRLRIARIMTPVQETDLRNQGKFYQQTIEDAFDYVTLLVQQYKSAIANAMQKSIGGLFWDALGLVIRNVGTPVKANDATTKSYVDTSIANSGASSNAYTDAKVAKTVRTPENIGSLPGATARAGMLMGFDASGNPVPVAPAGGPVSDASQSLWSRQVLSSAIANVHQALDAQAVSVWEFAGLIADKPTADPATWDWTTAINQAYVDAKAAGGEVVFPSGIYLVKDTVEVRAHSRFLGGACIEFTGFAADKAVINLGLDARNCRHYDLWVRNRDYNGDVSSCKGRGVVISSDPSNINNFGAYNQILINPRIDYCDTGLVVRSFQEVIICPQIASCRCGIAIAGTSGGNESGVISFESGQVRDCFEYCVYIGDPSILPITTNNINGVSISFKNTQLIGTFRATKASSIGLYNCNFECAGFGNGTAVQLDDDLYSILIDNPYFSAYEYGVRCTAQISALTIRNPTYYKNTKCGLYVFSAQAPFVYENPAYLGGNFTLAPELHIGLPQISATDVDFSLISVRMNGFVVNGGQQMSTKKPAKALHSAQYSLNGVRWVSVTSPNGSTPGICYEMPTVNIAGSLNSFIFTFNNPADAKYFAAGDSITCNAGGSTYGLVTRVDYEAGTMRLSGPFAASPTAGSVSQNTTSWEIPLRRGAFTWNAGTSTVTINDIAVKALSAIVLTPTNSAAAALMAGSSAPFVSNRTADTNFVLSTADGSNLAATATFGYAVINRI